MASTENGIGAVSRRFFVVAAACSVAVTLATSCSTAADPAESFPGRRSTGAQLLGTQAPPLEGLTWLGERVEPLTGQVTLVRWWTDTCPFCSTSAPALNELQQRFGDDLRIVGVYHPKPPAKIDASIERAQAGADRFGFSFPIAVDPDWGALRRWWLDHGRGWTSVSFLLDEAGVIRWIHPGGEYHAPGELDALDHWDDHSTCHAEYERLIGQIESLIAAASPATSGS